MRCTAALLAPPEICCHSRCCMPVHKMGSRRMPLVSCSMPVQSLEMSPLSCRCERRCMATRSCGRHQCKRRCCNGDCPPCDLPCGRKLRCGNHLCPSPCHTGPCQPCPLSVAIACACGKTTYNTPCGTESTAKPPKCSEVHVALSCIIHQCVSYTVSSRMKPEVSN